MNRFQFKWKILIAVVALVGVADTAFSHVSHAATLSAMKQKIQGLVQDVHTVVAQKSIPNASAVVAQLNNAVHHATASSQVPEPKSEVLLSVPSQSQLPDLYNGCEITSLSMLLTAANHPVDKMTLADEVAKSPTQETLNSDGSIAGWGDPNQGFVGDITGQNTGYGVYHQPIVNLLNSILPGQALDLTGESFTRIEAQLSAGKPVVAWTTINFAPTQDWVTWQGPNGPVRATFNEHCVLIVGYNQNQVFLNDPLDGTQAKAVDKTSFLEAWQQLGQQAVSFQ